MNSITFDGSPVSLGQQARETINRALAGGGSAWFEIPPQVFCRNRCVKVLEVRRKADEIQYLRAAGFGTPRHWQPLPPNVRICWTDGPAAAVLPAAPADAASTFAGGAA